MPSPVDQASKAVTVYTDGACSGNPGPGGWAWAVDRQHFASGFATHTTNQRMEIQAAYEAAKALNRGPLEIVSDSTYVVNCFRQRWWQGWIARGWINSQRKPVANRDLWEPFVELVRARGNITFRWVKGHGGDPMNEFVDQLAVEACQNEAGRSAGTTRSVRATPERHAESTVFLVCGAPGVDTTAYARNLAGTRKAICFSLQPWMHTLFGADPQISDAGWRRERRERCQKQIWNVCIQEIALERDVVLDLGFETKDQRERFRRFARSEGATPTLHYLEPRGAPAASRHKDGDEDGGPFEPPDAKELRGGKKVAT